ncbi:nuclear transport factor 2 family protein [Actinokineospora auranticolor]|uniref:Putative SnoaL-like aldol condensation-catalyzing enzyme n=1 Tax=Actinokineospora auranticolor TaxID=155976 RepID=A0A2S6GBX8_9PSEU|nr:nuclear transport factor 2 family protein [Actinokineospora auranticolor]PPK61855.1 putative SnoaL-like aldol condensation-catalyzing enzyme [Actinokineospora auranticolor]
MRTKTELVAEYLETVWNRGRTDLAADYPAEDLAQHNPNPPDGRAALVEFIDGTRAQLPGMRFTVERTVAEADLVAAHSHFAPEPGARGVAVVDIFRVAEGLIVEHWDVSEAVPDATASGREVV